MSKMKSETQSLSAAKKLPLLSNEVSAISKSFSSSSKSNLFAAVARRLLFKGLAMGKSKIAWTEYVWNTIIGCSKCSPGCENCYAEREARVRVKNPKVGHRFAGTIDDTGKWTGKINLCEDRLYEPTDWIKPKRIFVAPYSDLFHPNVSDEWLLKIFAIMASCPQHVFFILTKRPERMRDWMSRLRSANNIWAGVTVCNQDEADAKIPLLMQTPARHRFLSIEPMLGPIELPKWVGHCRIDWLICGGESGKGARPMHPDWARSLRDQCAAAGVPFFFKQWGECCYPEQMTSAVYQSIDAAENLSGHGQYNEPWRIGAKRAGRLLDGREHIEYPEFKICA